VHKNTNNCQNDGIILYRSRNTLNKLFVEPKLDQGFDKDNISDIQMDITSYMDIMKFI